MDKLLILTTQNSVNPFARTIIIQSTIINKVKIFSQLFLLNKKKGIDNRNIVPGAIINDSQNKIAIKQRIFAIGAAYAATVNLKVSKNIIKVIDNFGPEVIYTDIGGIKIIKLVNRLSKRYNIYIVPHFMDDWISTTFTGSIWLKSARRSLLVSLKALLENTKTGLCISQKMCDEYESKFNKKFLPLMNTIKLENFKINKNEKKDSANELVFTFMGGLHVNRWKSLKELSEALCSLSKDLSKKLILEIYTSQDNIEKFSKQFKLEIVCFYKFINHEEACLKMQQTDFLVHVESFDETVIQFTRLSISTKIPEYLASGTPIIAIGPPNIASIEYLKDNNCAYVITNMNKCEIQKVLLSAVKGEANLLQLQNSSKLVKDNHSSGQLELFRTILFN